MALFNDNLGLVGDRARWPGPGNRRARTPQVLLDAVRLAEVRVEKMDCEFSEDLERAVVEGDRDGAAYLLWAGVSPRVSQACVRNLIESALHNADLAMVRLLCDHHVSLMPVYSLFDTTRDCPRSTKETASLLHAWFKNRLKDLDPTNAHLGDNHPILLWLLDAPVGRATVACGFHKSLAQANAHWHNTHNAYATPSTLRDTRCHPNFDADHVAVTPRWPPRGKSQWPPLASVARTTLRSATHFNVLEYWSRLRRLRRAEAAHAAARHWQTLRKFARWAAPVALYWQEQTHKRLCAPGGEGRKRDFDTYQADGF